MMGDETTEQAVSKRQTVQLKFLYLDPNNFRFVDHPEYRTVPTERVFDADVQRRTTGFILGRSQENVKDLTASIKENGWLDIDPILVQRKEAKRFLVVEGNRRVATLKHLQRRYEENAIDLGRLDNALFSRIPVVRYEAVDERHHMVMMGAPPHLRETTVARHQSCPGDETAQRVFPERCRRGLSSPRRKQTRVQPFH